MPIQELVEYFNDRLEREHRSRFRPFFFKEGKAIGLFGPIRIESVLSPLRLTLKPNVIVGHTVQISVSPNKISQLYPNEIETLFTNDSAPNVHFDSIINFDRLSRTVHMLNYLVFAHLEGVLFLEVDPRHILGIKQDHGAYFEDVIKQCGLETKNIAIVLAINSQYGPYHRELINGLNNYRHRGYQISLKLDYLSQKSELLDLIREISPNYVSLSARNIDTQVDDHNLLKQFTDQINLSGGQSILYQIDDQSSDSLARNTYFTIVEGNYYRTIPLNDLSHSKVDHYELKASHF
jgi:hypothetical protein